MEIEEKRIISSTETGWFNSDGLLHRGNDLPAFVTEQTKIWVINGKTHRDNDLPAVISVDNDGNLTYEIWYINGKMKRFSKYRPVMIKYLKYGRICWYNFNGDILTEEEYVEAFQEAFQMEQIQKLPKN